MILLVFPIGFVARRNQVLAWVTAIVASVCSYLVADEIFQRVERGGWGDGLHTFVYVYAVGMAIGYIIAVPIGRSTRPRQVPPQE